MTEPYRNLAIWVRSELANAAKGDTVSLRDALIRVRDILNAVIEVGVVPGHEVDPD